MLRPYQTSLARHRRAAAASPVGRQRPRAAASPVGGTDRERVDFHYAPSRWKLPVRRRVRVLAADFSACTEDFAALRLRGEGMSKKAFLEACAELEAPYIRRREERLRETPRGSAGGVPARNRKRLRLAPPGRTHGKGALRPRARRPLQPGRRTAPRRPGTWWHRSLRRHGACRNVCGRKPPLRLPGHLAARPAVSRAARRRGCG